MRSRVRDLVLIVLGVLVMSVSYNMFLVRAKIAPGGVSGAATIIFHLSNGKLPVGAVSLVFNLPLFLLGWKQEGREFILKTLLSTVLLSLALDLIPLPEVTNDKLLSALFGGAVLGLGLGLVILGGATTGGTDLAAKMLQRKIPRLSMPWVLFGLDMVVILAAAIAFEPQDGLYALLTIYVSTKVMDAVMEGSRSARAFMVISPKSCTIAKRILAEIERGVTCWDATGMYSGSQVNVLYCVVSSREIIQVKHIIKSEDPNAFVVITDAHEVGGEGFTYNLPQYPLLGKRKRANSVETIGSISKDNVQP